MSRISEMERKLLAADTKIGELEDRNAMLVREREWFHRQRDDALDAKREARIEMGKAKHDAACLRSRLAAAEARVATLEAALRTLADAHLTRAAELVRLAPEPLRNCDREGIDRETVCGEWLTRVKADCRDARAALAGGGKDQ